MILLMYLLLYVFITKTLIGKPTLFTLSTLLATFTADAVADKTHAEQQLFGVCTRVIARRLFDVCEAFWPSRFHAVQIKALI